MESVRIGICFAEVLLREDLNGCGSDDGSEKTILVFLKQSCINFKIGRVIAPELYARSIVAQMGLELS